MEYNRNNKHQIVVHDKVIIEKIKLQGKIIEREVLVKEFKIPKIINSDIGMQLQFGSKGGDKPFSKGHMSWIYAMIQDGQYTSFKLLYENAKKYNLNSFIWSGEVIQTNYAEYVCKFVDNEGLKEYDKYIDRQSELEQASIEL